MKEVLAYVGFIAIVLIGVLITKNVSCTQKAVSFEDYRYGVFSGCPLKPLQNLSGKGRENERI